ncbi:MAG: molybdopterin converting factor subunit 1 [Betaproteobacteria bacterium]|nr:MAG: molybdopterin converting factor subunit 1 [Betaproteobacteria bacterium]
MSNATLPKQSIELVFLARLRERFGVARETYALPVEHASVAGLLASLRSRGKVFADELAEGRAYRVAVNHTVVGLDHPVHAGDEVAIFPPVTGG